MNMLREAIELWRSSKGKRSSSLQVRLFIFFGILILGILVMIYLLLRILGVFTIGEKESYVWAESQLTHLEEKIEEDFGKLSVQGTDMAQQLSVTLDRTFSEQNIKASELNKHPELLSPLLSDAMSILNSVIQSNQCSGVFIIMNATVNPNLPNAINSRAGIFLKRTESVGNNLVKPHLHFMRGPATIARDNGIELMGQWQMEFNVLDAEYYWTTLNNATLNADLPVSRLYYWSERNLIKGDSESAMLLCLPLIASDGTVYGICGIEVSAMLFKLQYSPNHKKYARAFSTLTPIDGDILTTSKGLLAGNSFLTNQKVGAITLQKKPGGEKLNRYRANDNQYVGLHQEIKMYPTGSVYQDSRWGMAVIIPESDYDDVLNGPNVSINAMLGTVLLIGLVAALFVSYRYIKPVRAAFEQIKVGKTERTNIAEIDDLLAFLEQQDEENDKQLAAYKESNIQPASENETKAEESETTVPDLSAYHEFVKNVDTLSAAERAVFNLYMEGYTAQEIAGILFLSMNTIKTHNKRIYNKLNVTSRKELMVFVQMMKS